MVYLRSSLTVAPPRRTVEATRERGGVMRIYIDSADAGEIREALATGFVYGVTTNPTLLKRAGVHAENVPDLASTALRLGAKEIHLQTYSDNAEGIIEEG